MFPGCQISTRNSSEQNGLRKLPILDILKPPFTWHQNHGKAGMIFGKDKFAFCTESDTKWLSSGIFFIFIYIDKPYRAV